MPESAVRAFEVHGVEFTKRSGNQLVGTCPFTGRSEKFYVNEENLLWDSKTAGLSGNLNQFLEAISERNVQQLRENDDALRRLEADRKLPRAAFLGCEFGFDGKGYTLAIRNAKGVVVDLRRITLGSKIRGTPGCQTGLLGAHLLASRKVQEVYICEGEWDATALTFLLRKLGVAGVVVAVPGANTFKTEWIPLFDGKKVQCLYDNDEAGEQGELLAKQRLTGVAKELKFVRWPVGAPEGFDVRDWVSIGVSERKMPKACWRSMQMLFTDVPRHAQKADQTKERPDRTSERPKVPAPGWVELVRAYQKWLHLKSEEPLAVSFGTVLCNRLEGDPLWLFLVGPPGSLKSELCMSISGSEATFPLSSMTTHSLVSGAQWSSGEDPSLMPKLDGKVLVIKDFTTVLTMNSAARDEIFGQLRDAYDGKFEKQFGNGVIRRYTSRFGILAGVTPVIDQFTGLAGLGERFLKYRLETNVKHEDERARIRRAIGNTAQEVEMREELQTIATRFLEKKSPAHLPEFAPGIEEQLISMAMLTARLRGVVNRDRFNANIQMSKASYEVGTRIGKQLTKLAIGIAMFYGKKQIDEQIYRTLAAVALSSAPDKTEEVIRTIYEHAQAEDALKTKEVSSACQSLTQSTVFRTLQDLNMLGIVRQTGTGFKHEWSLPKQVRLLIDKSQCYKLVGRK